MRPADLIGLAREAFMSHRMRYGLSALAVAVGVCTVVLLASLGEGTRRYVIAQVSTFGTSVLGVHAGKVATAGVPGAMGGGARKLTLDDARALARLPGVVAATPYVMGMGRVESGSRGRSVMVIGVGGAMPKVWSMRVGSGRFFPDGDWGRGTAEVVLGTTLKRELFGTTSPLGGVVRIADARFRVVGVMESKGQYLGFDMDDIAIIPVANAIDLFHRDELGEVNLLAVSPEASRMVAERARRLMIDRHREEDVTIVTQTDALEMVRKVLDVLTGAVLGIAAISLFVGAIGIFTISWIVVHERTSEIGLLKALGATRGSVLAWYLCEAAVTSAVGGIAGLLVGMAGAAALDAWAPAVEAYTPPSVVAAALAMALAVGLTAGVLPALRAAALDPIEALRAE